MKEYHLINTEVTNLPATIGFWQKAKQFWFKEIEIVIELTPKQEKMLKMIHDFWCKILHKEN